MTPDPPDTDDHFRHLLSFLWAQLIFTLLPGLVCASPLIFIGLAGTIPAFGFLALLAIIPALAASVFFIPALMLIRMFFEYEPKTLNGGSLLPLPAYSFGDWIELLTAQAIIVAGIWSLPLILAIVLRPKHRKGM